MTSLRDQLFADVCLPPAAELIDQGRAAAADCQVGRCAFLDHYGAASEYEYKQQRMRSGRVMRHAQIGYRSLDRSCRAYREIHATLEDRDCTLDRYGICLDWSMGYFRSERSHRSRGTGLILDSAESFARLTTQAPVAPHFGDFVLGTPAAFENTSAALAAGSTSIGNLGQYFTFRLPGWDDDVTTTAETVKAIAISTYNGVALSYLESLSGELDREGLGDIPVYIGGKLNQIVDSTLNTSSDLPVDVTDQLRAAGAIPCQDLEEMLSDIAERTTLTVTRPGAS